MPKIVKPGKKNTTKEKQAVKPEDVTEHMSRPEMVSEIMVMLTEANTATLRRIMDEVIKSRK